MSSFLRTSKGLAVDFAGTFLALALGLVIVPIYLRYFGDEGYGLWMTVTGIVGMSLLVDSGVSLFLIRSFAGGAKENKSNVSILSNSVAAQALVCLLAVVISLGLIIGFSLWGSGAISIHNPDFQIIFGFYFSAQILSLLISPYRNSIYAMQHLAVFNAIGVINALLLLLLPIPFYYCGLGLFSFPLGAFVSNLITDAYSIYFAKKHLPNLKFRWRELDPKKIRTILYAGGMFTALKATEIVRLNMGRVIIGAILGPAATTAYTVSSRVSDQAAANASKFGNAVLPLASSEAKQKDDFQRRQLILVMSNTGFRVASLFAIGIYLLNEAFINLWVGEGKSAGLSVTMVLCLVVFLRSIQACIGALVIASNKYGKLPGILFIETLLGIIIAVSGSRYLGIKAVVLGIATAYSLSTVYYLFLMQKSLGHPWRGYFQKILRYSLPSTLGSFVLCYGFNKFIAPTNFLTFLLSGTFLLIGNLLPELSEVFALRQLSPLLNPRMVLDIFKNRLLKSSVPTPLN